MTKKQPPIPKKKPQSIKDKAFQKRIDKRAKMDADEYKSLMENKKTKKGMKCGGKVKK